MSNQFGDTRIDDDLTLLSETLEEVLRSSGDVMVHEATLDITMEAKANSRGHSSTRQAATLAREAGVGKLIITHVSSRYDDKGCQHLLRECRSIFPATELANDFTVFNV